MLCSTCLTRRGVVVLVDPFQASTYWIRLASDTKILGCVSETNEKKGVSDGVSIFAFVRRRARLSPHIDAVVHAHQSTRLGGECHHFSGFLRWEPHFLRVGPASRKHETLKGRTRYKTVGEGARLHAKQWGCLGLLSQRMAARCIFRL